jgi:hypothetical protein
MPGNVVLNLHDANPGTLEELIGSGQDSHLLSFDIAFHQVDFRVAKVGDDCLEGKSLHQRRTRAPVIHVANTATGTFTCHEWHITYSVAHCCLEHSHGTSPLEA